MPIAQSKVTHRTQVLSPRPILPGKHAADKPASSLKGRGRVLPMQLRNEAARNVDREHFLQDPVLPPHDQKRKNHENKEERNFEKQVSAEKSFETKKDRNTIPKCVKSDGPDISQDRHYDSDEHVV